MSNGGNSNTQASTATITLKPASGESCIDDRVLQELVERLEITIPQSDAGSVVSSVAPPSDVTKIWQPIDQTTGIPIGQTRRFNADSGQWENPVPVTEDGTSEVKVAKDNNLLTKQEDGALIVPTSVVPGIAENDNQMLEKDAQGNYLVDRSKFAEFTISKEPCNALVDNKGAFVQSQEWTFVGPFPAGPTTGRLIANDTGPQDTFDLSTIPEFNEECHRYALVFARIVIKSGSGYSGGNLASPAVSVRAGFDLERIVTAIDTDAAEGTDTCNAIVRLNPGDLKTFDYWMEENTGASPMNWADAKNGIELYIKAFR